jgi:uncharacterized membrane protein
MRKTVVLPILIVLVQFIAAFLLYPIMPLRMAIHWNLHGMADGFGSRILGLFLVPAIELILIPVFLILPEIDPKEGLKKSLEIYDRFILGFVGFMAYIFGLTVIWNLGYNFDFTRMLAPALGALFYGLGAIMSKVDVNWFVGIRTPWTLSSKKVWDDTHRVGGRLFKVCGFLAFAGLLVGGWLSLLLALAPIMISSLYVFYYSYSRYNQLENKEK